MSLRSHGAWVPGSVRHAIWRTLSSNPPREQCTSLLLMSHSLVLIFISYSIFHSRIAGYQTLRFNAKNYFSTFSECMNLNGREVRVDERKRVYLTAILIKSHLLNDVDLWPCYPGTGKAQCREARILLWVRGNKGGWWQSLFLLYVSLCLFGTLSPVAKLLSCKTGLWCQSLHSLGVCPFVILSLLFFCLRVWK